ncbi:MAG: 6-bladed beta-propeller [Marinifilaceae bacterium]
MKKLKYLSFLFLVMSACTSIKEEIPVLDVESAINNPVEFDLKDYVESTKYIALETKKECLLSALGSVHFYGKDIYLSTRTDIYKFSESGKFIKQLGRHGRGPGEYNYIFDLSINRMKQELCVSDYKYIVRYDTTGNFIAKNKMENPTGIATVQINKDGLYFLRHSHSPKDTVAIDIFDKDFKLVKKIKNSIVRQVGTNWQARMSEYDGKFFYSSLVNDTIFSVDKKLENHPEMILNFGKYKSAPSDIDYFNKNLRNVYTSDSYIIGDNLMVLDLRSKRESCGLMLYFDKLNKLIHPIYTKESSYYGVMMSGLEWHIKDAINGNFIFSIDPVELLENIDKIEDRELKTIAENITEESNPVLAVVRIKG